MYVTGNISVKNKRYEKELIVIMLLFVLSKEKKRLALELMAVGQTV